MKTKTFILLCLSLGICFTQLTAQNLKKGAVVCTNTYTDTLNPDVTMNQFLDFYVFLPYFHPAALRGARDIRNFDSDGGGSVFRAAENKTLGRFHYRA